MIGLEVETQELGTLILASDAIYTAESMGDILKPPGILYDSIGWARSVEKIKRLAKEKTHKFGSAMMAINLKALENQQMDITNNVII